MENNCNKVMCNDKKDYAQDRNEVLTAEYTKINLQL